MQCNDHRSDVIADHSYRCRGSRSTACDLPVWPVDKQHLDTGCGYCPTARLRQRIHGSSYVGNGVRKPNRREWFSSERSAQRAILRRLTRDAMRGRPGR